MPTQRSANRDLRDQQLAWVATLMAQAGSAGFYGRITFFVENGVVKRVEKAQSLLPPGETDGNRPLHSP